MNLFLLYRRHLGKIIILHCVALLVSVWSYKSILPLLPWFLYPLTLITPEMILFYLLFLVLVFFTKKPFPFFIHFLFLLMFTFGVTGTIFFPTYLIDQGFTWWRMQNVVSHFLFFLQIIIVWQYLETISWWKQIAALGVCTSIIYLFFAWKTSPYFYSDYPWIMGLKFVAIGSVFLAYGIVYQRLKNKGFSA